MMKLHVALIVNELSFGLVGSLPPQKGFWQQLLVVDFGAQHLPSRFPAPTTPPQDVDAHNANAMTWPSKCSALDGQGCARSGNTSSTCRRISLS